MIYAAIDRSVDQAFDRGVFTFLQVF